MKQKTAIALIATVITGVLFYYFGFGVALDNPSVETASGASSVEELIAAPLNGTWQSSEDPRFTREFKGMTVIDRYEGQQDIVGSWRAFTASDAPEGLSFTPDPQSVYLQITEQGTTYNFVLTSLSDTDLSMMYLDRPNPLNFKRIR